MDGGFLFFLTGLTRLLYFRHFPDESDEIKSTFGGKKLG
jgi:hypothetical protein